MPPFLRKIFWFLNTFFMVPVYRLGLGAFLGTPFGGYIMVLKVIGRKSGKVRFAPVNYAIHEGDVYCVSGGRKHSDWYRNIMAHPKMELILPGGALFVQAEEVNDLDTRRVLIRQILKDAGFAGFFEGYNPWTISDAELETKIADIPLLRFRPLGVGQGAFDSGGWAWVWPVALTAWILYLMLS